MWHFQAEHSVSGAGGSGASLLPRGGLASLPRVWPEPGADHMATPSMWALHLLLFSDRDSVQLSWLIQVPEAPPVVPRDAVGCRSFVGCAWEPQTCHLREREKVLKAGVWGFPTFSVHPWACADAG